MLTELEDLKYQLQTLASYAPSDLDNPEFEVEYEDGEGNEAFATVCCIQTAERSLMHIKGLEKKVADMAMLMKMLTTERSINLRAKNYLKDNGLMGSPLRDV